MTTTNHSYKGSEKTMDLVIQSKKGNDVTTSLIVAEVFGKEHKNVLRDIESLSCSEAFSQLNFEPTPYTHPQNGQTYKMYEITKDGFSFLVMGYTGAKAGEFKEKFINEFNKREMLLKSDDYILMRSQQILQRMVDSQKQQIQILEGENEYQQQQIEVLAPKANYTDKVLQSTSTYTMTQVAKEFGMSAHKFGEKLKSMGIMFYQSGTWLLTAKYQNTGYTKSRTHTYTTSDGRQGSNTITVWTEIGRAFLHAKLDQLVA